MATTIKDLGEIELLNRLKKFMRCGQIDDDLAEINTSNKSLLITNSNFSKAFSVPTALLPLSLFELLSSPWVN